MDNIYIDYNQGATLGHKIQGESTDLKNLLDRLREIQEQLKPILNDSNDEKYVKTIDGELKVMEKLAETIDETGSFLVNVSNAYQDAAESIHS